MAVTFVKSSPLSGHPLEAKLTKHLDIIRDPNSHDQDYSLSYRYLGGSIKVDPDKPLSVFIKKELATHKR